MSKFKRVASYVTSKYAKVGATVALLGSAAAQADDTPLDTALNGVTTAATTGITSVQSHASTVIAAVFGITLLMVGAKVLFSSVKQR